MSILDESIPFNVFSICAIRSARRYIELMEAQLSQAHADERAIAIEEYEALRDPNEVDYDVYVQTVDRMFEEDFRPMMRFSAVVHLYQLFETYLKRHVAGLQKLRRANPEILKEIQALRRKQRKPCGLVAAAKDYFRTDAKLIFGRDAIWEELQDLADLRHCIVHDGGIISKKSHPDSILRLESRCHLGKPVGITLRRFESQLLAEPVTIHQQFFQYFLDVLEHFFTSLGTSVDANFPAK